MTLKGATSQACAACKYQRRRCHPDCPLAPYFPADKPKKFQNAHKLFGVSNIMKILKQVPDDLKDEAMKSIIFESDMRQRFPVHGCSYVTSTLRDQLQQYQEELHRVKSLLATLRSKEQSHSTLRHGNNLDIPPFPTEGGYVESNDIKPTFWIQSPNQNYTGNICNYSSIGSMKSQIMQEISVPCDYYDDMAYNTIADERRRDKSEACESSAVRDESIMNEAMKSMNIVSQNHELKIAAACFSLKSAQLAGHSRDNFTVK